LNYPQAVKYLYDLRRFGLKPGLEKTFQLAGQAGNPQARLRFIHVAGTNGKGSACAMLEAIYRAAGLKVGLFTSPHLVSFRERIQVNRRLIAEADVARLVGDFGGEQSFTFFEAVTIMALKYFAAQRCDLVVWETGLGGRLDATNIVTPLASIITNVQLDHEQWLGRTIPEIALEKAGIIKPGAPVITAAEEPALGVISKIAAERGAPLTIAGPLPSYEIGLPGAHQRLNAAVAVAAVRALSTQIPVDESAIRTGLKEAHWAGRLQKIRRDNGQIVVLDGAHNPAGARTLAEALSTEFRHARPAIILGAMADKDCAGLCQILAPLASRLLLPPVGSGRSADPRALAELCRQANSAAPVLVCDNLAGAVAHVAAEPFVVITGSLHFIGEAMECLGLAETASERELNEYTIPQSDIRAVTFDIGGTLIEPWPSVGHVYAEVAARHGLAIAPEALNRQFAAAWKRKKNFGHGMSDWSNLVDETFAGLIADAPSQTFFGELYDQFARKEAWRIFDDAVPTLQELRRRGVKLAAVSNWDERLRPLLRALDLDRYFDTIVVSAEVGCAKPGAEIFRVAAGRLGLPPGRILHVGDSQVEDYEGAIAAGFQALLVQRGGPINEPGHVTELAAVLGKI
jgi:dihydrofolate synthase/folylpolyglutamate synthase